MIDDNKQHVFSREVRERLAQLERQFPFPGERPEAKSGSPKVERKLDTADPTDWAENDKWFDDKIEKALEKESDFVQELIARSIRDLMDDVEDERDSRKQQVRALENKLRDMEVKLARAEADIAHLRFELRLAGIGDRRILDLPNPIDRKAIN
jgi:hypothetical protein